MRLGGATGRRTKHRVIAVVVGAALLVIAVIGVVARPTALSDRPGARRPPTDHLERLPHRRVGPAPLEELVMGPHVGDTTAVEHHDPIGGACGLESVGDDHSGPTVRDPLHGGGHPRFGRQVEIGGGFVQQEHRRVDQLRPGEGDQLALTRREGPTASESSWR